MNPKRIAKTEMLIRRSAADVFEAFVDPAITSKFWFTGGTGRLETGRQVLWHWEMYHFSLKVDGIAIEPNERIVIGWSHGDEPPSRIEWTFKPIDADSTFVTIENSEFSGTDEEQIKEALNSTEGFTFVLAGAKAWLEHGVQLHLVRDRHPAGFNPDENEK